MKAKSCIFIVLMFVMSSVSAETQMPKMLQDIKSFFGNDKPTNDVSLQACRSMSNIANLKLAILLTTLGSEPAIKTVSDGVNWLLNQNTNLQKQKNTSNHDAKVNEITQDIQTFLEKNKDVRKIRRAANVIRDKSPVLLNITSELLLIEAQDDSPKIRISIIGDLRMLSQRIAKNATEVNSPDAIDVESLFILGKDAAFMREYSKGLFYGDTKLRLSPAKSLSAKKAYATLHQEFDTVNENVNIILSNAQSLVDFRNLSVKLLNELGELGKSKFAPACFSN